MRDTDNRTCILLKMLFQPVDRLGVQMVGRLVQQQYVRLLQQQAAKGYAAAFTTRERVDNLIFGRTAQGVHRPFQTAIEVPCVCCVYLILQFGLTVD